ncbi:lysophospholipid acyltransferase family protein [Nocardioides jishulii]|uniref:1-acyl-sn-glycerol-3-phosphate acyltransferase n=1 Tax=Nocardioides jishulii TaxID=2575440 RepID=A0A4U2YSX9_9ACTN|nr:lysophospholipid acyltransferase family protein [Nocardioides jishulii]QCX28995.1 1-acyl-sn-glycerol-3-phosphate acyltransferase [Nocardioides jishulii]TKI64104.1 1-acyl-sn-glycerol-3-phosphate acyltransferase [Nocardioides jishulii]
MRDITYPPVIATCKTLFKVLGQKITITGAENIPRTGGALMAFNHIGYVDFVYGGLAAQPAGGRVVRFMAKKEVFDHPVGGPIMRSLHHIPVDRGDGVASFRQAVDYLKKGELVGIFPEATISRAMELKEFKNGAVRIAATAGVPVIPVVLWGTQLMMTKDHPKDFTRGKHITIRVGEPLMFTGEDANADNAELHRVMSEMLEEVIAAYPADQQPPGSWWVPARLGGSAPTLERAAEMDAEEKRERARRRAEKRAAAAAKKAGKTSK